ncbi:MAG: FAD-dependent oxidoreductase [Sneathiella sp.]
MKVVIVGAGQGGFQLAASLRKDGFEGHITLVGEEVGLPYQRPPLSKKFLKDGNDSKLLLRPASFYERNRINLRSDTLVRAIHRSEKCIETSDGDHIPYDHLVLATGTKPEIPPVTNLERPGIFYLRTLADAQIIRQKMATCQRALVIGGGFIGLEFAAIAASLGMQVTLVEGAEHLMARAVSEKTARKFLEAHINMGTEVILNDLASEVTENHDGSLRGLRLSSGRHLTGDMILVATGVAPNVSLAKDAGLSIENGVLVDRTLTTSDPSISALGDCAAFPDPQSGNLIRLESVQAATDHARHISRNLTASLANYNALPWFWSDQGALKLQIAGIGADSDNDIMLERENGVSTFCFCGESLKAVESINSPGDHMAARRLLSSHDKVSKSLLQKHDFSLKETLQYLDTNAGDLG